MISNKYELNVLINGKPVREYYHKNRFFIEAKSQTEYSIKFRNHSHKRVMAIFSVDGIDVLTGKPAEESQSGYIVNAFSSLNVLGYRVNDSNVITFKFDSGENSYATEVECQFNPQEIAKVKAGINAPAKNNGVIGVRVWEEKTQDRFDNWSEYHQELEIASFQYPRNYTIHSVNCSFSGTAPMSGSRQVRQVVNQMSNLGPVEDLALDSYEEGSYASASCVMRGELIMPSKSIDNVPKFTLGTSWGQQVEDKVKKTNFNRADSFVDLVMFYLPRIELENIGVDVDNSKKVFISGMPEAFGSNAYCKTPINWKGNK